MAAGHHDRVVGRAVGAVERHLGQIDQVEHVGVDQLGGEIEGHHVEGAGRQVVLEREQGQPGAAHGRLHVHPGGVGPLGHGVVPLVEDLVEDLEPLVGQADLVRVGIDQQPRGRALVVLGHLGAELPADVAGRLLDLGQEGLNPWPEGLHLPRHPRATRPRRRTGGRHRPQPLGVDAPEPAVAAVVELLVGAVVVVVVVVVGTPIPWVA